MGIITGTVTDKKGTSLSGVFVALKNSKFEDVFSTLTNENGEYYLEANGGYYPFMIAVKEYGENYLEFWCQNINLTKNIVINASIDKLEIYGLNCFRIKGAYPALTIYLRPMSLAKHKAGDTDISPDITNSSIKVSINSNDAEIYKINKVEEYCGAACMTAYLFQVSLPDKLFSDNENLLDVQISDLDGFFGQASIFF